MNPRTAAAPRPTFTVEEVRIIADLRIMHSKVDELYQVVVGLQQRHSEGNVCTYADTQLLADDIRKVDEIYLWFVKLKERDLHLGSAD